jgi:hypothetical protein
MDSYSIIPDEDMGDFGARRRHIFRQVRAGHDYCSLVDKRCRDFIHWIRAASA